MYKQLMAGLIDWKANTTERQKLQHTYLFGALLLLVIAGIISLLDNELGQNISYLAFASIVAFTLNSVIWNLAVSSLLDRISDVKTTKKK